MFSICPQLVDHLVPLSISLVNTTSVSLQWLGPSPDPVTLTYGRKSYDLVCRKSFCALHEAEALPATVSPLGFTTLLTSYDGAWSAMSYTINIFCWALATTLGKLLRIVVDLVQACRMLFIGYMGNLQQVVNARSCGLVV